MDAARDMIYLDANATTPPAPGVGEAVGEALRSAWGNPSSRHPVGQAAREALEAARAEVAALLGAEAEEVVFTSGATEANRLAIAWAVRLGAERGRRRVCASPLEHPSVRDTLLLLEEEGAARVRWLPVGADGRVDVTAAMEAMGEDTALVTCLLAQNETGVLQPVAALAGRAREVGALVHCDAAQALGRVAVDAAAADVDLLAASAHKVHGPRGTGALVVRGGLGREARRIATPGHQERGLRPGTEDVPGIAGFGVACRLARASLAAGDMGRVGRLRDRLEQALVALGAVPNGGGAPHGGPDHDRRARRLPNTVSVRFPGLDGAQLVLALARAGICASTGSACLSERYEPSHVLLAMGLSAEQARGSLRLSLTRFTTEAEVDRAAQVLAALVPRLRRLTTGAAIGSGSG